ncbi:unnamed protein product [Sphagnum troendelagicum]|uniref:Uncharacterized protein n=1 Tax=Sphagnum troendelagicum TaxID=128251 RepID=A0ABP0U448_9BRYO
MEGHHNLVMPTEGSGYPDSLGTLTVWGIFKETARVIQKHVRLLLPFVLTFTLPVSIYVAISWGSIKLPNTLDISPAIHARSLMQTSFTVTAIQQLVTNANPPNIAVTLATVLFGVSFGWLQIASIAYSVDFVYKGNDNPEAKPVQEIFKRLPGALFRIFVTCLWVFLLNLCIGVLFVAAYMLCVLFYPSYTIFIMLFDYTLLTGVFLIFSILFMFSNIISTLDVGCYGRPALKQSFILVTQNKCRVLSIFVVQFLICSIVLAFGFFVSRLDPLHWTKPLGYICLFLVNLIVTVYSLVLQNVLYFSCKQLENATTKNYMALDAHAP